MLAAKTEMHRELADALSHLRSRALLTARDWSAQTAGLAKERASECLHAELCEDLGCMDMPAALML